MIDMDKLMDSALRLGAVDVPVGDEQDPEYDTETCQNCGEPATWNVQKTWIYWPYDPTTGEFGEHKDYFDAPATDADNRWFCDACLEKWEHGEI